MRVDQERHWRARVDGLPRRGGSAPVGRRRVILATDIAETSVTIEGIGVVVDCGLTRKPRFQPGSGLTRLVTEPISRASAQQRAGRRPADNRLDPNDLNELDRRILKEAFRQARKLQSRLKLDYQLSL